ncbi:hypothetical protein [Novosphingobium cyanobacteriorum]|uniref:Uncharacterized protein n=1 Tax=Novosphingobium cyanobacteriorum TaxID=3024215 RepID=A0ABT6CMF6_9SPHN|nr:hypothetical protein [Novosphingobium cyanobacteriorum]MDF8335090.1 hypothetical protein [Novosphingobium cyanobacteriorum]
MLMDARPIAQIIPFPTRWQRAWLICAMGDGTYRGEVHGLEVDGPRATQPGRYELVLSALQRPDARRGLPIITCRESSGISGAADARR